MPGKRFEIVDHTADWALRIYGRDLRELLLNATEGMNSLMASGPAENAPEEVRQVELDVIDAESLLVEWLGELAFFAESEMLLFDQFEFQAFSDTHLRATVRGRRTDQLHKHIKAVTYHDLAIVETAEGIEATVVFDV